MSFNRLSAWGGCELIADTTERENQEYFGFIVQEDTVVEKLTGEGSPSDRNYLTEIGLNGKTLKQGALIVAPNGEFFQHLKLASGSVIAYK